MRCLQEDRAELELPWRGEADGEPESVVALAEGRSGTLLTVLQRSMDSAGRVARIQLTSVQVRRGAKGQSQEWEQEPRCPKR
jgi:hypothetical protein